ncbi:VOC family protein [Cohnella nanjingensis]|uniref:VOC family protein n=1 Tax=Cohnella nanjingensis TaxID=1387779 RepID=A0A7X0VDW2_9BACL|nr:VOC family protein [Cohnella nanjingensis]MBB6670360.1 VOC family protein [Cohnella nanjingensis]
MSETHIAPWLSVSNAAEAAAYYKAAFSAVELYRLEEGGRLAVAQLSIGGGDFWIQEDPDSSPESIARGSVRMILTVQDPDSAFEQAVAAGATGVVPVGEGHGWRIGRIADPFGHHWEIGKRLI